MFIYLYAEINEIPENRSINQNQINLDREILQLTHLQNINMKLWSKKQYLETAQAATDITLDSLYKELQELIRTLMSQARNARTVDEIKKIKNGVYGESESFLIIYRKLEEKTKALSMLIIHAINNWKENNPIYIAKSQPQINAATQLMHPNIQADAESLAAEQWEEKKQYVYKEFTRNYWSLFNSNSDIAKKKSAAAVFHQCLKDISILSFTEDGVTECARITNEALENIKEIFDHE